MSSAAGCLAGYDFIEHFGVAVMLDVLFDFFEGLLLPHGLGFDV